MKYLKTFDMILEAKNLGSLYHFTSLINLYNIITEDRLFSDRDVEKEIYNMYKSSKNSITTFSFTRNKHLAKSIDVGQIDSWLNSRIEFDGNKMSNKYKIRPYNWQGDDEKDEYKKRLNNEPYRKITKVGDESEELIFSDSNYINNISNYIISLTIPQFGDFYKEFDFYIDNDYDEFNKLETILHKLGYIDFNSNNNKYDIDMVRKTYNYIKYSLEKKFHTKIETITKN